MQFQFQERSPWFGLDADVVVLCESNRRNSLAMHVGEEYIDALKPHSFKITQGESLWVGEVNYEMHGIMATEVAWSGPCFNE